MTSNEGAPRKKMMRAGDVQSSKGNVNDKAKHGMLWLGILIGAVVAIVVIGGVLLLVVNNRSSENDGTGTRVAQDGDDSADGEDGDLNDGLDGEDFALSASEYDTEMARRVLSAIPHYQTNNNGKFPAASECQVGDTALSELADKDGVRGGACSFIRNYLNSAASTENEFADVEGEPYDLVILPNRVVADDEPHTFYVYPNGRCGNEKVIISGDSYAVSYKATDDAEMICVEESIGAKFRVDE